MPRSRVSLWLAACCLLLGVAIARAAEPSREQRLKALPEDDRAWLTDFVAPIIQPEEEKVFLQLTEPAEREGFKEDFWRRRETLGLPLPLGPGYRDRYRELRQILDAKSIGWKSDAGRLILRRGEPDSIFKPQCGAEEVFRDLEIWTYGSLELNGHAAARHIFYRSSQGVPRRLWIIHDGNGAVFLPNACRLSFDQLSRDCSPSRDDRCSRCEDRCVVYGAWVEILKRQGSPAGALEEQGELFGYPKISTAGLDRSKAKWGVAAQPAAKAPVAAGAPPAATPTAPRQPTATPPPVPTATRPPTAAPPTPTVVPPTPTAVPPTPTAIRPPTVTPPPPTATRPPTLTPTPTAGRKPAAAAVPLAAASPTSTPMPRPEPTHSPVPVPPPVPTRPTPAPTAAPTRSPTVTAAPRPTSTFAPTPDWTPIAGGLRRLSSKEIQDRIETLEPDYKEFVDLARPLLTEDELSRFLQLSGHDKDAFIRDFWKRNS